MKKATRKALNAIREQQKKRRPSIRVKVKGRSVKVIDTRAN